MARKDELIAEAEKLEIKLEGSETIAILEEKIKLAEDNVAELSFDNIVDKILEQKEEIAKKESRNATLNQLNKNRTAEVEIIKKKSLLNQTKEDKDAIKEKNKIINENNRQISKNLSEIMDMKMKVEELEREKSIRIPEMINLYVLDYVKVKCEKDYICDQVINLVTELMEKHRELELLEIEKRNELNEILNKHNIGDISADIVKIENELEVDKSTLSQKLRSYVRAYSKKLTQFRKKV